MNLNLVIDTSQFKPFDISPALQILHDYRDAYYKYQDRLDKIAEENGQYILPDTEDNKQYREIMDKYKADFEAAASDFSNHMNLRNQKELLNLFRRQRSEIVPINKAVEAYNKDVDKITALGPDVTIANRNNRKISDYYGGVNPGLDYRNNKSIQSTAAGVMQGLDNALMGSPQIAGDIANQYFILKQRGIDGQDALEKILSERPYLNNQEGVRDTSQLMNALNTVYDQYAFEEGTPENEEIWKQVVTGAIQGIQAPKYSLQTDSSYRNPHQQVMDSYDETEAMYETAYKRAQAEANGFFVNPKTKQVEFNPEEAKKRQEALKAAGISRAHTSSSSNISAPTGLEPPSEEEYDDVFGYGDQTCYIKYFGKPNKTEYNNPANWTVLIGKNVALTGENKKAVIRQYITSRPYDQYKKEANQKEDEELSTPSWGSNTGTGFGKPPKK